MPTRHIGINRNNRDVLYGVHSKNRFDQYWASQREGEVIDYRIDLKNWMDQGETITEVTETTNSLTATKTLNSQSVDYVIEGCGFLEVLMETSLGKKKKVELYLVDPERNKLNDYPCYGRHSYGC